MSDPFTLDEIALESLLSSLGSSHSQILEALTLQSRLQENIDTVRQHGDSPSHKTERSQIRQSLNRLALETLGRSFNSLRPQQILAENRNLADPNSEQIVNLELKRVTMYAFQIPADREEGIDTGIYLHSKDKIMIRAEGIITFDAGKVFVDPDGIWLSYLGKPVPSKSRWPLAEAFFTSNEPVENKGIIGSLFGWIGNFSKVTAFYIGRGIDLSVVSEGNLWLCVNDVRGQYADNQGSFHVTVHVMR